MGLPRLVPRARDPNRITFVVSASAANAAICRYTSSIGTTGGLPIRCKVCRPLLRKSVEHNINYIQCSVCVPKPTEYATASGAAGVERLQWNHEEQRRMPHIG